MKIQFGKTWMCSDKAWPTNTWKISWGKRLCLEWPSEARLWCNGPNWSLCRGAFGYTSVVKFTGRERQKHDSLFNRQEGQMGLPEGVLSSTGHGSTWLLFLLAWPIRSENLLQRSVKPRGVIWLREILLLDTSGPFCSSSASGQLSFTATRQTGTPCLLIQKRIQGAWEPGPPAPKIFSKSCRFQAIVRERPLFWAHFGLRAPLGSFLCWGPPDQNPWSAPADEVEGSLPETMFTNTQFPAPRDQNWAGSDQNWTSGIWAADCISTCWLFGFVAA